MKGRMIYHPTDERPHPDDDNYSVYDYGHLDFPDEYQLGPCGIVLHIEDVNDHDRVVPCELCSPDRYEEWSK